MTHQHGYIQDKQRYLARLKRIQGQVGGLTRMIEEDQYCIDVLTQISAVNSALKNVGLLLLDDHLRHCVAEAVKNSDEEAEIKFQEVSEALARFSR
ncbi:metal-sensitive transcriptional regulator [Corynebacterium tapiri]|uniref:Metal-sensitive transcriptional regulator n=1 Tax=Corynebacterium tapiri TaxID=1448266 RepID=A0A5C4U1Q4_9CORY|nr:metal-sensitive transcriptional regulator [Corynebacterium tapiri]TNL95352.1 metal-sensitive transcriptional regulator [Corynebacterium tapiri]